MQAFCVFKVFVNAVEVKGQANGGNGLYKQLLKHKADVNSAFVRLAYVSFAFHDYIFMTHIPLQVFSFHFYTYPCAIVCAC